VRHARATLGVLTIDRRIHAGPISFDRDVRFLGLVAGMAGARVRLQQLENPRQREVAEPGERPWRPGLVAVGPRMRQLVERVELVAQSRATVFLRGESGTGKEVVARAIHDASPRAGRPFVAVNCAALPESLVESELFGHEKGAFTGAAAAQKGRFEMADGGTLFLDEVGELSPAAQAKLLRVVQERQFERVGGRKTMTVDVRIVAATNRDLEEAVRSGTFRVDLYHRLSVVTIVLPPLRERREDIPALAEHFLRILSEENGRAVELDPDALDAVLRCRWSGNVRQLRNCLERAVVSSRGPRIGAGALCLDPTGCLLEDVSGAPASAHAAQDRSAARVPGSPAPSPELPAGDESARIRAALERCAHVQAKAARLLGFTERQLAYRIRKYAIEVRRF
jgi:Nif-specific regulatory protein